MSRPLAAQLQLLPVFQRLVPVRGRAGCESQWWYYLFVTQKVRGKSMVDRVYNVSSEMESFHFGTGGKKGVSQYRLYAKDTWMHLSLHINGVGERIAFHIRNCFYF